MKILNYGFNIMGLKFKAILEFLPLILFMIFYKFYTMKIAIIALIISTAFSLLMMKLKNIKIPQLTLVGYAIMLIFGALTVYTDDAFFIKIKPTIINIIFASILVFDRFRKYNNKLIFKAIPTLRALPFAKLNNFILFWAGYFIFCSILNEIVWRNFDEETWVYFKVFGFMIINVVFLIVNLFLLRSYFNDKDIKTRF